MMALVDPGLITFFVQKILTLRSLQLKWLDWVLFFAIKFLSLSCCIWTVFLSLLKGLYTTKIDYYIDWSKVSPKNIGC